MIKNKPIIAVPSKDMKIHKEACNCETCEKARYWTPCGGCKDGHSSFWKIVVESPQWKKWEEEVSKRMHRHVKKKSKIFTGVWDTDECQGCGYISQGHFQDFIKFIKKLK